MNLIILLLALLLSGVLMSRLLGGSPVPPRPNAAGHAAGPAAAPRQQAQQAVDAASEADRQRLDHALKALDPGASP